MAENRFKYKIVADDETAKGVKSAEKRVGTLEKAAKRYHSVLGKPIGHAAKSFSGAHSTAYRALAGGSSPLKAVADRLGAIREAGAAAKSGLVAATEGAGLLEGGMSALGVVAGGAIGTLVAAGVAGYKFASGWVEGGAALGRLSQQLNMTAEDIQKFQTAGERFGIDKAATAGGLGGFGSTIHEAIYGRNNEALATLGQLGIGIKRDKDGKIDETAMLKDVADAIARQKDPYTQQRIGSQLNVSSLLPLLRQGSKGVQAELDDAGKHGAIMSTSDTVDATRINKTGIMAKQAGERLMQSGQASTARFETAHVNDAALAAARAAIDGVDGGAGKGGTDRAPASSMPSALVKGLGAAAKWTEGEVFHLGGAIGSLASRIEHLGEHSRQDQVSPKGARGVMQVIPETAREVAARHNIPWSEDRYRSDAAYSRQLGDAYLGDMMRRYGGDETLASAAYNAGPGAVDKWLTKFGDPRKGQVSDAEFAKDIPYKETRNYVGRVAGGDHRIVLELHGLPAGVKAVAKSQSGGGVAVAYAMAGDGP